MATFDPNYASVPQFSSVPATPVAPAKQMQSPAMPKLGFGGVSTIQQYQPETMSTVSKQIIDMAKKVQSGPYEPTPAEIESAKKSKYLSKDQAKYVIGLNKEKDPREVLKDLVENQGFSVEGLNVKQPAKKGPINIEDDFKKEAKRAFVTAPGTLLGSGIKLAGWVVDIGEELLGGGDFAGEAIKSFGEDVQNKAQDFGEVTTGREGLKFVSDMAFPLGGLAGKAGSYLAKVPGASKVAGMAQSIPGVSKATQIISKSPVAQAAGTGMGYGAVGTAMMPGADLGDIALGTGFGGVLGGGIAGIGKGYKAASSALRETPINVQEAQDKAFRALSPTINKLAKDRNMGTLRAKSDRANEIIAEEGFVPTNRVDRAEFHGQAMKNVWGRVQGQLDQATAESSKVDLGKVADAIDAYIAKNRAGAIVGRVGEQFDELAAQAQKFREKGRVDVADGEILKQFLNAQITDWGDKSIGNVVKNGYREATKRLGEGLDESIASIPGKYSSEKRDFWALRETYEDVVKQSVKAQREAEGGGIIENYWRMEGAGDVLKGIASTVTGNAAGIGQIWSGVAKFAIGKKVANMKDKDRMIGNAFEFLSKNVKPKAPATPKPTLMLPPDSGKGQSANVVNVEPMAMPSKTGVSDITARSKIVQPTGAPTARPYFDAAANKLADSNKEKATKELSEQLGKVYDNIRGDHEVGVTDRLEWMIKDKQVSYEQAIDALNRLIKVSKYGQGALKTVPDRLARRGILPDGAKVATEAPAIAKEVAKPVSKAEVIVSGKQEAMDLPKTEAAPAPAKKSEIIQKPADVDLAKPATEAPTIKKGDKFTISETLTDGKKSREFNDKVTIESVDDKGVSYASENGSGWMTNASFKRKMEAGEIKAESAAAEAPKATEKTPVAKSEILGKTDAMQDLMKKAEEFGASAESRGKSAPITDTEFMKMIEGKETQERMDLMKAWNRSKNKASANAPDNAATREMQTGKPEVVAKKPEPAVEIVAPAKPEAPKTAEIKTFDEYRTDLIAKKIERIKNDLKRVKEDPNLMRQNKAWFDHWSKKTDVDIDEYYAKSFMKTDAKAKKEYIDAVRKEMKAGKLVSEEVINQFPELRKAVGDYERYLKGWKTSFANKSTFVEESGIKGLKIKRQDGKPITEPQKKEILDSIAEFEYVHGDISDILKKLDLTIAHTSGKNPFLKDGVGWLYHSGEKTITIGVGSPINAFLGKPSEIKAFTHELTHALDDSTGEMTRNASYSLKGQYDKEMIQTAMKDMRTGRFGTVSLVERKTLNPEAKAQVKENKIRLGEYWNRPNEIFARLSEQFTAMKLGEKSKIAQDTYETYTNKVGWWDDATFQKLAPMVEAEMKRKLSNIRNPENKQLAKFLLLFIGGGSVLKESTDKSDIIKRKS